MLRVLVEYMVKGEGLQYVLELVIASLASVRTLLSLVAGLLMATWFKSDTILTIGARPSDFSLLLRGRHRTTTQMVSSLDFGIELSYVL